MPQQELVSHYRAAKAVILPSLAPESFGLTVVEAFACGTPAIVRSAGGNKEAAGKTEAGLIYENEEQLHQYLGLLSHTPELRSRLGIMARKTYEENYTEDLHIGRYLQLIDELTSGTRGPRRIQSQQGEPRLRNDQ